ncbi:MULTISPECIES: hypothetical protein [unclassified Microcoleus]|uniref:hypothetical protein n=1 Tax=unclassified Microcoleus TaxID=2642155 RepID=UPI002FD731E0
MEVSRTVPAVPASPIASAVPVVRFCQPSAVPATQSPQNPTHRPKWCILKPCQCQPSDRLTPGHSRSPRSHPIALLNLAI